LKILIVDDNDMAADLLAELLADDHEVCTTYSAGQARDAAKGQAFDVALVDVNLPDMPGGVLATALRDVQPQLVVIAVTASSLQEIHAMAGSSAFAHILQKPIHFEDLATILSQLGQGARS
jgi:CheY-like chemotaxis protein